MSNEMRDEKLWEDYVDPAYHGRLFTVGSLLYAALPGIFPNTDAVRIKLDVTVDGAAHKDLLYPLPDTAFLVRLLADRLQYTAVLNRLHADHIKGIRFPNAADIVWLAQTIETGTNTLLVDVVSSGYWLSGLERVEAYQSTAYADKQVRKSP